MAKRRVPKRRRPKAVDESNEIDGPEYVDDDDIIMAEDDDIECLGDDDIDEVSAADVVPLSDEDEEITGEFDVSGSALERERAPQDSIATGEHDHPFEKPTEELDSPEDPLASFAAHARNSQQRDDGRSFDDDDYEEEPGEDAEPTGRALPPESPDFEAESTDARPEESNSEDVLPEGFDLEPVGRRRNRRRRPAPEVEQEDFEDETDPHDLDGESVPGGEEEFEDEPAPEEPPWAAGDGDSTDTGVDPTQQAAHEEVRWSALPEDEDRALPDCGATRVENPEEAAQQAAEPAEPVVEKTLIFNDPDAVGVGDPEPECAFLLIVQGEEEGREIDLLRDEITMGRGPENDLVFADIACSRHHAMVEREQEHWKIVDLGSGNGTLVNGEQVQEMVLVDGDEIEVGNTVLQFSDPEHVDAVPDLSADPADPRSTAISGTMQFAGDSDAGFFTRLNADPKRKKMFLYGGIGLGGFIFMLLVIRLFVPSAPPEPTSEELARKEAHRKSREFDSHMRKADVAIQSKAWKDAMLEIQMANSIDPDNRNLKDYLDTVKREMSAASALEQARMFMEQKAWDSAVAAVNRIPSDSEYRVEADRLKIQIDNQITDGLLLAGQDLMRQGKFNQALLKFDAVLKRNPENTEVKLAKRQCEEEISREERHRVARTNRRTTSRKRRKRKKVHRASRSGVTGQALSLYKNGEIDRAIAKAEGSGSSEQLRLLKQFRGLYQKGMKLAKNPGQAAKATKSLSQALSLDKKISGGSGKYRSVISEKLGRVLYIKGVDAHTRRDYPAAYKAYRAALKYKPDLDRASKKLDELGKIAKKLFEEAYIIKATNAERAIKQLGVVMKIVPASHVYYSKAKKLRARIQGPLGNDGGGSGF